LALAKAGRETAAPPMVVVYRLWQNNWESTARLRSFLGLFKKTDSGVIK